MSFEWPLALLGLLAVPLAVYGYVLLERRRSARPRPSPTPRSCRISIGRTSRPAAAPPSHSPSLALAALAIGVARPHANLSVKREEATIVLAIDTSRSMVAKDVPPSRLAVAQDAVGRFLD